MLATKDPVAFLANFRGLAQDVVAVPMPTQMAARSAAELADAARRVGLRTSVADGLEAALEQIDESYYERPPRILICGSLYLAGEVLAANGTPPV